MRPAHPSSHPAAPLPPGAAGGGLCLPGKGPHASVSLPVRGVLGVHQLLALSQLCGFSHPIIAHFLGTPRDHKSFLSLAPPLGARCCGDRDGDSACHPCGTAVPAWCGGAWTVVSCPLSHWCHHGPQGHVPSPAHAQPSPGPLRAQDEASSACDTQVQAPISSGSFAEAGRTLTHSGG